MKLPRFAWCIVALLVVCGARLGADPAPTPVHLTVIWVHGAWAGGWQSRKIVPLLEAAGCKVLHPSLSGLGEHFHNASPAIGLETHINDIVNLVLFEDLHDVVLVGHSYGGMVITGVADRIPGRIRRLVYLDAFLPENGESVMSLRPKRQNPTPLEIRDGMVIPTWVKPDKPLPRDVPQPLKTFEDPIQLSNDAARAIPSTYILTVDAGKRAEDDDFYWAYARAQQRGWPVRVLEANHVPQWYVPDQTARALLAEFN